MGQMGTIRKKIRETIFFYLRLSDEKDLSSLGEDSEFYANAFLSAARSVIGFFDGKQNLFYRQWYRDWKMCLTKANRKLLNDMVRQRNLAVHEGSAHIIPEFGVAQRAKGGACKRYFWINGKQLDVNSTCTRYLELLLKLVTDFEQHLS